MSTGFSADIGRVRFCLGYEISGIREVGLLENSDQTSEAHKHRLGFKMNVPEFFHALLDVLFQPQNVRGRGLSAVHDGQRMLTRDTDSPAAVTLAEAGVLDQPG